MLDVALKCTTNQKPLFARLSNASSHYLWPNPAQFIFFSLSNLTKHIRTLTTWTISPTTKCAWCIL